ncbi:MAG: ATP-binding protein, partial [Planctomycetota bacterium]
RHGYERAEDRPIWLSLWPLGEPSVGSAEGIRIVIEDEAKQVNPDDMVGRELDDIRPGGLGVHIMREVMDSVEFAKRDGAGMRVEMTKTLPAAVTADSA